MNKLKILFLFLFLISYSSSYYVECYSIEGEKRELFNVIFFNKNMTANYVYQEGIPFDLMRVLLGFLYQKIFN